MAATNPFGYLNFCSGFPPTDTAAVEVPLRVRFATIGVRAGKPFPVDRLTPEQKAKLETAMRNGLARIKRRVETFGKEENGWRVSTQGFGSRQMLAGDWTMRAAAAIRHLWQ